MKIIPVVAAVATLALAAAPSALAKTTTKTAHSGNVKATLTYSGAYPTFSHERLTIRRSGRVYYSEPVVGMVCGRACAPVGVRLVNLEGDGQSDVVLELFTGGAHCCTIAQVFTYDPGTMTYAKSQHDFGDPGYRLSSLAHNGVNEFVTADDWFAYEFTDFAASGLPIQILRFSTGHFLDITRTYPALVAKDATVWLNAFNSMAKQHYSDSVGVIAAWAADEDLLGNSQTVATFLTQQAQAGHLNSALNPKEKGQKFITALDNFLRKHGYLTG
ncbi:MAG TPA: hypothetical protein VHX62_12445 [Solirubrobacteraceae bacterium]|jgi:hypothetical protein|nr:hypothetical protein [Solirubrobacteraceae bacterium]